LLTADIWQVAAASPAADRPVCRVALMQSAWWGGCTVTRSTSWSGTLRSRTVYSSPSVHYALELEMHTGRSVQVGNYAA